MNKQIKKIIKAIEAKNETVIHEGMFCQALDIEEGVLLWCKPQKWLGLRKEKRYFNYLHQQEETLFQNVPIYKKGSIRFLTPELTKIINQLEK